MINFCLPGIPITAWRALKNVLQTRRVYQSRRRRFFTVPRGDRTPSLTPPKPPKQVVTVLVFVGVRISELPDAEIHDRAPAAAQRRRATVVPLYRDDP